MRKINIIYAPDAKSSGSAPSNVVQKSRRSRGLRQESAEEYLDLIKPMKSNVRLQFKPSIPKTLTRKGYAKFKLMASAADRQYDVLTKHLRDQNRLWEDPAFPAENSSVGDLPHLKDGVEWKRPKEINPNAVLFKDAAKYTDVILGELDDAWLLSSLSSIARYPQLLYHVISDKQQNADYLGVYRVRIWCFGEWIELLIDDRLPVIKGTNDLLFARSEDKSVFWSALVEKAYAKFHGSYANLQEGTQAEAMENLTGGIVESIELKEEKIPSDLLNRMIQYSQRCCLMGAFISKNDVSTGKTYGLVPGNTYSVITVRKVVYGGRDVYLVRCRNPWGKTEWTGPWSDGSEQWSSIDEKEKKALNYKALDDGEFWMPFDNFAEHFSVFEVCHLGHESLDGGQDLNGKNRLEESIFSGQWEKNVSSGGCINNRSTFFTNPQFCFNIQNPDPNDPENKTLVIIGLMQRSVGTKHEKDLATIGFMVYRLEDSVRRLLTQTELLSISPIAKSQFDDKLEVTTRLKLSPGFYVIIPSTMKKDTEAKFIIRIFSVSPIHESELDNENCLAEVAEDVLQAVKLENDVMNEDQEMEEKFDELADPKTKTIELQQLLQLLNESSLQDIPEFKPFGKELARSALASFDDNQTGQLDKFEFLEMWRKLKSWKIVFLKHDIDQTGVMKVQDFREALESSGFTVSNKLFSALVHRYQDPETRLICFEDFLLCMIRLTNVFETANAQPKNSEGANLFSLDDYLRSTISV
ncbi:unnamed protein product [Calicophoron daubneyi]|uniref:Uncharacterized protein n=1 Tax=Calicophoron daubneyi TaxID=300641 RepID=A0AAV2TXM7_CALDB